MFFLTTGEKVRSLRKKLGMRQQELEDVNITRAFISMVETGKRGLGRESARIIAEKLSNKALKLGLKMDIDEEYILRTPEEDAEVYCTEKLKNNPTSDEIDVILEICKNYKLISIEAKSYKILGDYAFEAEDYKKAFINYMISLDLYKDTKDTRFLAYLYNRLGFCKYNLFSHIDSNAVCIEAVLLFERGNHYAVIFKDLEAQKCSLYNMAKIYKILKNYEKSLEYVEKYSELCDKDEDKRGYVVAEALRASCCSEKGNIEKAISIYTKLLEHCENDEEALWYVYNSLGTTYADENNFDKSKEFFDKAEKVISRKDMKKLSTTFVEEAAVFIRQGLYKEAVHYASKGVSLALEFNYTAAAVKGYYRLIEAYSSLNDFINLRNTYVKLLDIIKNKEEYKNDVIKLYNSLALLYLEQNDVEMCKKYLSIIL